jgi:hypothetical protein
MTQYQKDQVVIVAVELKGGEMIELLGSVHHIYSRAGALGDLIEVDIFPATVEEAGKGVGKVRYVRRYAGASRIRQGDLTDAVELQARRAGAGVRTTVGTTPPDETQALTTRNPTLEADYSEAAKNQKNVMLFDKGGQRKPRDLSAVSMDLIFAHPQVQQRVAEIVNLNQKPVDVSHLTDEIAQLKTQLQSCDHERRQALVELNAERNNVDQLAKKCDELDKRVRPDTRFDHQMWKDIFAESRGYVLWCPISSAPPKVVYKTLSEAINVRNAMCKTHPNKVFHIMAIGQGKKITVVPATNKEEFV